MTQTRYVNPNGLPDARQLTSARDLAILARAVMRDYPQYYSYFGLHDWAYNGRDYRNTNGLLRGGDGYDGMKTGYTNASGYNLAASAVRDGRRIITIVLGGRSTASRNAHVAALMNTGFEVEQARARGETIQVAQTFFEARGFGLGPDSNGPIEYAAVANDEDEETGAGSSAPPSGHVTYAALPANPNHPGRVACRRRATRRCDRHPQRRFVGRHTAPSATAGPAAGPAAGSRTSAGARRPLVGANRCLP
jgi:D-alanyl-D-alanine carboxypeptidase